MTEHLIGYQFKRANGLRRKVIFGPLPESEGGADFSWVGVDHYGKPVCSEHGAMNKVSPSPPGYWRCLGGLGRCPAGCQELEVEELPD